MCESVFHVFVQDDIVPAGLLDFVIQLGALVPSALIKDKNVVMPI